MVRISKNSPLGIAYLDNGTGGTTPYVSHIINQRWKRNNNGTPVLLENDVDYFTSDKLGFLIGTLNPFRWKGHYLDTQTGLYYIGESWYDAETGRYVNAGTAVDLIANATEINGTNLYSFCYNNPHSCGQNSGNHESYFELLPGEKDGQQKQDTPKWVKVTLGVLGIIGGVLAVATGIGVMVSGVAAGLAMTAGYVTAAAGALTAVNSVAEIVEVFTGQNAVKEQLFGGNQEAYNWYSGIVSAVALVGTIYCGNWLRVNQPRIRAYKAAETYNVKGRHLPNSTMNKGKFLTAEQNQLRGLIRESIINTPMKDLLYNSADSYKLIYDFGAVIGTKGQTTATLVFTEFGKIITFFPK